MTKITESLNLTTPLIIDYEIANYVDNFLAGLSQKDIYPDLPPSGMPSNYDDVGKYIIDRYFYTAQRLSSEKEIKAYTDNYSETILNQKELTESDKFILARLIKLAGASFDLWNTIYNL